MYKNNISNKRFVTKKTETKNPSLFQRKSKVQGPFLTKNKKGCPLHLFNFQPCSFFCFDFCYFFCFSFPSSSPVGYCHDHASPYDRSFFLSFPLSILIYPRDILTRFLQHLRDPVSSCLLYLNIIKSLLNVSTLFEIFSSYNLLIFPSFGFLHSGGDHWFLYSWHSSVFMPARSNLVSLSSGLSRTLSKLSSSAWI